MSQIRIIGRFQFDGEWADDLEDRIAATLDALMDYAMLGSEAGAEARAAAESTPSGEPFCGCETCVRRETVTMTIEATLRGQRDGVVELVDE